MGPKIFCFIILTIFACSKVNQWKQPTKVNFNIDVENCVRCGGTVRVIASIEDQDIIDRILAHLSMKEQDTPARPPLVPPTRPHLPQCLFSRGRAHGSRIRIFTVQSAGTPLNNSWHRFLCASAREWMETICEGADTSAISR